MTPEQRSHFERYGWMHWPGALDRARIGSVRDLALAELKRLGIGSGKGARNPFKDLPVFQQINKLSGLVSVPELRARITAPHILSAMRELAGVELSQADDAQLLLSPPRQGEWTLQRLNWHTDVSASHNRLPGIQVFAMIDDVLPQGGGTLVISGSHGGSARLNVAGDLREILRRDTDPRNALAACGLSIMEMTGRAGDVYLMDMRVLHAPAVNASTRPRVMATARYLASQT